MNMSHTDTYNLDYGFQTLRQSVQFTWGLTPDQLNKIVKWIDELENKINSEIVEG